MPSFGLLAYIVAWIVMPKDPVTVAVTQVYPAN
jgi:phage shock protein PspC (stress-responsive transcriptional regulator)